MLVQLASLVPRRLSTHSSVERENKPSGLASLDRSIERFDPA